VTLNPPDIESFKKPEKLPPLDLGNPIHKPGPPEPVLLQPLLPETESIPVPVEDFQDVPSFVGEDKEMAGERSPTAHREAETAKAHRG